MVMGLIKILILNLKIVILIQIKHNQWHENPKTRKRKCKRIHSVRVEIPIQYNVSVYELRVQVEKPK